MFIQGGPLYILKKGENNLIQTILIVLIIFAVSLLLSYLLLNLQIRLQLAWTYTNEEHHLQIKLLLKSWVMKEFQVTLPKQQQQKSSIDDGFELIISIFDIIKETDIQDKSITKILNKSNIHDLQWKTIVGTGNAAHTGMLIGSLWPMKGLMIGAFRKHIQVIGNEELMIEPTFNEKRFETDLSCMMHIKFGQAMKGFTKVKRLKEAKN